MCPPGWKKVTLVEVKPPHFVGNVKCCDISKFCNPTPMHNMSRYVKKKLEEHQTLGQKHTAEHVFSFSCNVLLFFQRFQKCNKKQKCYFFLWIIFWCALLIRILQKLTLQLITMLSEFYNNLVCCWHVIHNGVWCLIWDFVGLLVQIIHIPYEEDRRPSTHVIFSDHEIFSDLSGCKPLCVGSKWTHRYWPWNITLFIYL